MVYSSDIVQKLATSDMKEQKSNNTPVLTFYGQLSLLRSFKCSHSHLPASNPCITCHLHHLMSSTHLHACSVLPSTQLPTVFFCDGGGIFIF